MAKAKELLDEDFSKDRIGEDASRLLHDCACIMDTAGKVTKALEDISAVSRVKSQGKVFRSSDMIEANALLHKDLIRLTEKLYEWLPAHFCDIDVHCILDRLALIFCDGMRHGDIHLWKSCFKGHAQADSDSDPENGCALTLPLGADSFFLRIGGKNIPALGISGEPDEASLTYGSHALSAMTSGLTSGGTSQGSFRSSSTTPSKSASGAPSTSALVDYAAEWLTFLHP